MIIVRAGIMAYWRRWYEVPGNDCLYPSLVHAGEVRKIDLVNMTGCYLLLAWGLLIGFMTLFAELFYFNYTEKMMKGEKFSIKSIYRDTISRMFANPIYTRWATSPLRDTLANNQANKLAFIYPQVKSEVNYGTNYGTNYGNNYPTRTTTSHRFGRGLLAPMIGYDPFNTVYSNQLGNNNRNIYNNQANNYYSYPSKKTFYKNK